MFYLIKPVCNRNVPMAVRETLKIMSNHELHDFVMQKHGARFGSAPCKMWCLALATSHCPLQHAMAVSDVSDSNLHMDIVISNKSILLDSTKPSG